MDVIVVTYNSLPWVERLLPTLGDVRTIVVDNASTDGTRDAMRRHDVELIENTENRYLSPAWQQGLERSRSRYVTLLNPDCEVDTPGWADELTAYLDEHPDVGIVGPRLLNADGSVQHTVFPLATRRLALRIAVGLLLPQPVEPDSVQDVPVVSGACLVLRRAMLDEIGGIDVDYKLYWEEGDLCFRAWRAGWRVVYDPDVTLTHAGAHATAEVDPADRSRLFTESRDHFYAKHFGRWFVGLLTLSHWAALPYRILRRLSRVAF